MRMTRVVSGLGFVLAVLLAGSADVRAQEATMLGRISDESGGVLPGVTVRAIHEATGNSFEAITDERGEFRLSTRVGTHRLVAELQGFSTMARTVTLLVGQQAVVNLQMVVSTLAETLTVRANETLLDLTDSSLGGNIDPRQMSELPVNGRNWMDLVMLAPGARANAVTEIPQQIGGSMAAVQGDFQLNMDGQQVTWLGSYAINDGQPRFSRDAIAELQFVSNRFDATQGRSSGVQINAITKSGSNTPTGTFSGYFRDDSMNAADFVAGRVLGYQDQQFSTTFGGPIRHDRVHAFANYEFERQPVTYGYTTPFSRFNADVAATNVDHNGGVRIDAQFSPRTRLMVRGTRFSRVRPTARTTDADIATATPSTAIGQKRQSTQLIATLTSVMNDRFLNELKGGYAGSYASRTLATVGPRVQLLGLTVGAADAERQGQDVFNIRDDVTLSFTKGGRHTVKLGAEFLHQQVVDNRCEFCTGLLDATGGPIPSNIEDLFPSQTDPSTWNLAPLSSIAVSWRQAFGNGRNRIPRYTTGAWLQDDWGVSQAFTLNLGVRYDVEVNAFANDLNMPPFLTGDRPNDLNNISPRVGFAYSVTDRSVLRGGFGVYFGTVTNSHHGKYFAQTVTFATDYDGRADFAVNPFNGAAPTYEQLLAQLCTPSVLTDCIRREVLSPGRVYMPNYEMPYSYQGSIGIQRQVGDTMSVEADYAYIGGRNVIFFQPNVNLTYNPETGVNYPFSDISRRVWPEWGVVSLVSPGQRMNYHALQTAVTRRFSDRWQASGTYTLSVLRDINPVYSGLEPVSFPVASDLGGEYTLARGDQRHRATFNGIWELPHDFQVSGLYFFGSGERFSTFWGSDLRQMGMNYGERRLRPDGTIIPRNNLAGEPLHRIDIRLTKRFHLAGVGQLHALAELFNVFNHANYGGYVLNEAASNYGAPVSNLNPAYLPRMLQLGFRLVF